MQIVIDLPDENYQVTLTKIMLACYGCRVTELPKGHGRLIDADDIALIDEQFYTSSDYYVAESAINDAPTIIEADAESEDKT